MLGLSQRLSLALAMHVVASGKGCRDCREITALCCPTTSRTCVPAAPSSGVPSRGVLPTSVAVAALVVVGPPGNRLSGAGDTQHRGGGSAGDVEREGTGLARIVLDEAKRANGRRLELPRDGRALANGNRPRRLPGGREIARIGSDDRHVPRFKGTVPLPIHVIYFDDKDQAHESEQQLRSFTDFAGGDFGRTDSQTGLTLAQVVHAPIGGLKSSRRPKGTLVEASHGTATTQIITGKVVLDGHPVTSATVPQVGTDIPPINLDDSGRLAIRNVPPGNYQIKVHAIAANLCRLRSQNLTVGANAVDISLDVNAE
jgi:hypothetical protein